MIKLIYTIKKYLSGIFTAAFQGRLTCQITNDVAKVGNYRVVQLFRPTVAQL